jgi:hypothetical protein
MQALLHERQDNPICLTAAGPLPLQKPFELDWLLGCKCSGCDLKDRRRVDL